MFQQFQATARPVFVFSRSLAFLLLFCSGVQFATAQGAVSDPAQNMAVVEVNINKADADTLAQTLDGVGISRAKAIVEYREQHGPFNSIEDLIQVKGIGESTLQNNRSRISIE